MTKHAQQSHAGQVWNTETISAYFDAGFCKPTKYDCPDREIHVCNLDPEKAIGLVISKLTGKRVTGFVAMQKYWHGQDGCSLFQ